MTPKSSIVTNKISLLILENNENSLPISESSVLTAENSLLTLETCVLTPENSLLQGSVDCSMRSVYFSQGST